MGIRGQDRYCANHQDRQAFALCMGCSKVLCQECATQWDGINYCAACLGKRGVDSGKRSQLLAWGVWGGAVFVLGYLCCHSMTWGGAILARLL